LWQVLAADPGRPEPDPAVEVVECGEGEVDRRGLGAPVADQVGAVVPDGVVAGVAVGERVALLAAQDGVEVRAVALQPVRQVLVEASYIRADRSRSDRHPARLLLSEVLVGR